MKIIVEFDVRLEEGKNYARDAVGAKLVEELQAMDKLYMEDRADTRYAIDRIETWPA